MKIVSVYFDYDSRNRYERLGRVLAHSAKLYCPSATFELVKLPKPSVKTYKRCFDSNTVKIEEWLKILKSTKEDCIFMDADMVILRDITDIFNDGSFDVAFTQRDGRYRANLPMNGGFVAVRNNPAGIEFLERWVLANQRMYDDIIKNRGRKLHNKWRSRYAGMNQAAFGYLIHEMKGFRARLKTLLCSEWNACVEHWMRINPQTRVIHVKSALRNAVLSNRATDLMTPKLKLAVSLWRKVAADMGPGVPDDGGDIRYRYNPVPTKKQKPRQVHRRSRYLRRYVHM